MRRSPVTEAFLLVTLTGLSIAWVALSRSHPEQALWWVAEDGVVEWATVAVYLILAAWIFRRIAVQKGPLPLAYIVLLVFCLFVALEEISWGQRLFGWSTPDWMAQRNIQGETNLHNIQVGGIDWSHTPWMQWVRVAALAGLLALGALALIDPRVRSGLDRLRIPPMRWRQMGWLVGTLAIVFFGAPLDEKGEVHELLFAVFLFLWWGSAEREVVVGA